MYAMYSALTFCCENNKEHFKDLVNRKIVFADDPELVGLNDKERQKYIIVKTDDKDRLAEIKQRKNEMMVNLYEHLARQSLCGFFACLVYSSIFVAFAVAGLALKESNERFKNAFQKYVEKMLPDQRLIANKSDVFTILPWYKRRSKVTGKDE